MHRRIGRGEVHRRSTVAQITPEQPEIRQQLGVVVAIAVQSELCRQLRRGVHGFTLVAA